MEPIIRAILTREVESVKKLLGANLSFFMRKDQEENVVIIYCHEEFKGSYNDEYMKNFERQKKKLLELLDNDKHKTKSEQHQIGLDFLLFTCKFLLEGILNCLIHFRFNCREGKWDLTEILNDFEAGEEEIYNFLLNEGIGADEFNRLHLLHRYVQGDSATEEMVKRFLQLGVDVNCLNFSRCSVLSCAIYYRLPSSSRIEIIKLLLKHGADPNLGSLCTLTGAVQSGHQELVELLLEHGACINGCPGDVVSPLSIAASFSNIEIVELLLDRGAERDNYALYQAVKPTFCDMGIETKLVKLLLDRGFDPNFATQINTVLTKAIKWCHIKIVKLLLDYGAQVDEPAAAASKLCPLHTAVVNDKSDVIQLLLDYGADINKECNGATALKLAVDKKYYLQSKIIVKYLILRRSLGLFVSEANLNITQGNTPLTGYYNTCDQEIKMLKIEKFDDSTLSYFDMLTINDTHRLASLANNENIAKVIGSEDFKTKFPIYSDVIVKKFNKGVMKKKDFTLFKRFIDYLSIRDHDQLPKLPLTFVSEIFFHLNDRDVATLRKL